MEFIVMNLLKRAGLHTSSQARNLSMGPFYTSFSEIVNGLGIEGNFPTLG